MSQNILFNGTVYTIPDVGDDAWGQNLEDYFVAISAGALQKTGGAFTLTADVNFGASKGLLAAYFSTRTALPATAGLFRLAKTDSIGWRNNANSGNLLLGIDGSDSLTFNGNPVIPSGALTASRALISNASGVISVSSTTSAELAFVSGVTSQLAGINQVATLTNKTLTAPIIATISNVGTLTLPASTDTLIGRATTDTLTNKSISGATNTLSAIPDSALNTISTAGKVSNSATTAASANTGSAIVARDSSGNFSAGTITASLSGNASGLSATLVPTSGGTGLATYTTGDVLYASAANTLSKLPIGSSGQFLGISAGVPAWGAVPATALVVKSKTANYTILSTDNVILASGSAFTLTLPAASTVQILYIKKTDSSLSNIITIARAGSDTIDGATSTTLNTLNETITLVSDGSTTWQILDRQSVGIWTQYTPTLTGFGTASSVSFWWKRLGDSMIIRGYFVAGTSTAVAAKASLPSGAALSFSNGVDSSILGLGVFTAQNSSASAAVISNNGGVIFSDASDTGNLFFGQSSSAGGQSTIAKLNGSSVALSSWGVSLANIIIPISGWN